MQYEFHLTNNTKHLVTADAVKYSNKYGVWCAVRDGKEQPLNALPLLKVKKVVPLKERKR